MSDHQNNHPECDDLVDWMPELADLNDQPRGLELVDWMPEPADHNDQPQGRELVSWMPEPADHNDQPQGQELVSWMPEPADHNDQPQGQERVNLMLEPPIQPQGLPLLTWDADPAAHNYQPHGPQPINWMPAPQPHVRCPRCESYNTKFSYYNNYTISQPRYYCKSCKRYWTHGGTQRDVPIGGARRPKRARVLSPEELAHVMGVKSETIEYIVLGFGRGNGM